MNFTSPRPEHKRTSIPRCHHFTLSSQTHPCHVLEPKLVVFLFVDDRSRSLSAQMYNTMHSVLLVSVKSDFIQNATIPIYKIQMGRSPDEKKYNGRAQHTICMKSGLCASAGFSPPFEEQMSLTRDRRESHFMTAPPPFQLKFLVQLVEHRSRCSQ